MPHGHCYLWRPELMWLHVASDLLIAASYFSIPVILYSFARRRRDLPFRWLFLAFGAFIVSCGLTHLLEVVTLWEPLYWLSGGTKAVTAGASVLTASLLLLTLPRALTLPSPAKLREANAELTRVQAHFRAALDGMSDGFVILDPVRDGADEIVDFRVLEANTVSSSRLGVSRGRLLGATLSSLVSPGIFSAVFALYARAAQTRQTLTQETCIPPLPGEDDVAESRWLRLEVMPLEGGVAVTSRDITSRKRVDEFMLRNMSEGLCLVSAANDLVVFANPKFESMLGHGAGELAGKDAGTVGLASSSLRARPRSYEEQGTTKGGARLWTRTTTDELEHPDYGPVWLVMRADITEKKAAEATMARLAAIVASTSDAIVGKGQTGTIETWNEGAERLYGYTAAEMIGAPSATIIPPELIEEERALLAQVWRGERVDALETIRVDKGGKRIDVSVTASPIRMPGGAIVGVSSIARDVSQRKRFERALQASLREKDVLLAEVHHRVKNNLQIVVSLLKLHAEKVTDPAAVAAFEDGQARVHSIALLHEMLYHSKDLDAVAAADYVHGLTDALLRAHAGRDVRFVVAADGVLLDLDDAVPFGMILNELVTNSLKHAFAGEAVAAPEVRVEVRATADEIELVVSDNGVGFPPGFDAGSCDSLGMHIMLALSGQLGGTIQFEAGEGGARSRLAFPNPRGKNV